MGVPPALSRPVAFVLVGALGFCCQVAVLHLLTAVGVPVGPSAALAVLAAVANNFVWHRRWTWRDRSASTGSAWTQLVRFTGLNGVVSLVGNVVITSALASTGVPVVAAGTIAVVACSALNFMLADRLVFATSAALLLGVASADASPAVVAAVLQPDTLAAWKEYVRVTEQRIAGEEPKTLPLRLSPEEWQRLKAGERLVSRGETRRANGSDIDVPDGAVHHWVGRVFLPGVQLADLLKELQRPTSKRWTPAEVLSMNVVPRADGSLHVLMRVERRGIVDVVYDMEHDVRYAQHVAGHATSRSVSSRIVEVEEPGTRQERARPEGDDHGFLWRLNAYWRYVPVEGGVLVQCESLALSRSVPFVLRALASPIISRVSRESLENTLAALRKGFASQSAAVQKQMRQQVIITPSLAVATAELYLDLSAPTGVDSSRLARTLKLLASWH